MSTMMSTMTQVEANVNILIAAIPMEIILSLLEDVYTSVILPTTTDVLAIVNKMMAIAIEGMFFSLLLTNNKYKYVTTNIIIMFLFQIIKIIGMLSSLMYLHFS